MTPDTWTYRNLMSAIQRVLSAKSPYAWIADTKPIAQTIIYGDSGSTYEASYSVGSDGTITLGDPTEVREQTVYWPAAEAAFSEFSAPDASGRVRWKGLIFRGGRFPERPIREITADDVAAIAASVPPEGIPIRLDHNEGSFLTEALDRDGAVLLNAQADGIELYGEVDIPGWLAAAARDLRKSVSVGLDSSLRAIRELSFVKNPRVADAAVFATLPAYALFAQAHPDLAKTVPKAKPAPIPKPTMSKTNPTLKDRIKALFGRLPADQREGVTEQDLDGLFNDPDASQGDPATLDRIKALEERFSRREQHDTRRERHNAALAFYETQLRGGKAGPADRQTILDDYVAAATADESLSFAADSDESFVKRLAKRWTEAPVRYRMAGTIDSASAPDATTTFGVFDDADFEAAFGRRKESK